MSRSALKLDNEKLLSAFKNWAAVNKEYSTRPIIGRVGVSKTDTPSKLPFRQNWLVWTQERFNPELLKGRIMLPFKIGTSCFMRYRYRWGYRWVPHKYLVKNWAAVNKEYNPYFVKREVGAFQNCCFDRIGFSIQFTPSCLKVGLRYLSKTVLPISGSTA